MWNSTTASVSCGVPQASILSPLLFLDYIKDLPNYLKVESPKMFADDTNITLAASALVDIANVMNSELRNFNCWLVANRLSLMSQRLNSWSFRLSPGRIHAYANDSINNEIEAYFRNFRKRTSRGTYTHIF